MSILCPNKQAGASLTEFLLVLPILGALFYAAQFLHDIIEHRQVMRIASRNSVHLPAAVTSDFGDLINKTSPVHADVWQINASRQHNAGGDYGRVEATMGEGGSFAEVSGLLGTGASFAGQFLDGMQNFSVEGQYLLLPNEVSLATNKLATGSNHPLVKPVMAFLEGDVPSVMLHDQQFHRPEVGFHPTPYQYQAIFGLILGDRGNRGHWHAADEQSGVSFSLSQSMLSSEVKQKYIHGCIMNFVANSKCAYEPQNMLATTIRTIGVVKGVIQFILDLFSGGGANGLNTLAREATNEVIEKLMDEVLDKAIDELEKKGMEKGREIVNQKIENFSEKVTQKFSNETWSKVVTDTDDQLEGTKGE